MLTKRLPKYFYDINAVTDEGRVRWVDEFADDAPHIIKPSMDLNPTWLRDRDERNLQYAKWMAAKSATTPDGWHYPLLKPCSLNWQVIQVLSVRSSRDWWGDFRDALFRVFVNPQTVYDGKGFEQWYLLSPEDCYLVNRYEIEKAGAQLPPRDYAGAERWVSSDKRLRKAKLIPVECCRHWKHETTAGVLPEGL